MARRKWIGTVLVIIWLLFVEIIQCAFSSINHVADQTIFQHNTTTCSELYTRRGCHYHSRKCTWKQQGNVAGLFRCETKDEFRKLSILPYKRVGSQHQKLASSLLQHPIFKCAKKQIIDLSDEPCYSNSNMNIDSCGCGTDNERTYVIPQFKEPWILSNNTLAKSTMFVFIHANKAAGETIKAISYNGLSHHSWDGAGYGTRTGWQYLEQTFWPVISNRFGRIRGASKESLRELAVPMNSKELLNSNRGGIMYSQCGERFSSFEDVNDFVLDQGYSLSSARECPLRFIWGNSGMGLCDHFPGRPCVYFISLRDPLSRALSDYYYFCVDGAEGRKKWTREMIEKGECNVGPLQWFQSMRTSPYFFVERLTRGCDAGCGAQAALANLFHPCVRYILVEKFADGLHQLRRHFYPAFSQAIEDYLHHPMKINRRGHGQMRSKLKTREISNSTLETLRQWMADDYVVYNEAVRRYEEQWSKPLASCNAKVTSQFRF
jgi:hypothetical protein